MDWVLVALLVSAVILLGWSIYQAKRETITDAAVAYYRYKLLERFEVLDDPTDDEEEASGDLSPNLPSWDGPVGARGFKGGPLSG